MIIHISLRQPMNEADCALGTLVLETARRRRGGIAPAGKGRLPLLSIPLKNTRRGRPRFTFR
jgi:hypothetical protein